MKPASQETVSHKILIESLSRFPGRASLSGIARALGIPAARFWFYVSGQCRIPADQFLLALAAIGALRVTRTGFRVTVNLDDATRAALIAAGKADITVLRTSKLVKGADDGEG